jgi:choline dehydrogenase-like flavoprotein
MLQKRWPGVPMMPGRFAAPLNTLELAIRTGRVHLRQGAIVREVNVNDMGEVTSVIWVDARRRTENRACAPLVFLCASTLETTRILMLSRSKRHPIGLGGASGTLGRFLMDHVMLKLEGIGPKLPPGPLPQIGRCIYLPHFHNRNRGSTPSRRGFGVQLYQSPAAGDRSYFTAVSFGEMLPRIENFVAIDQAGRDAWGIPTLHITCTYDEPEYSIARQQAAALQELADLLGVTVTSIDRTPAAPGSASHECGTARMGNAPTSSVLDPHNECWDARGLFVTDGACFPSQGSQNPTLTMLALTARACDYALARWRTLRSAAVASNTR